MDKDRFDQQIRFILEIDKLKSDLFLKLTN